MNVVGEAQGTWLILPSRFFAPPAMAVCFISKQIGRIACALKTKFLTVDFVFLKRLSLSRKQGPIRRRQVSTLDK